MQKIKCLIFLLVFLLGNCSEKPSNLRRVKQTSLKDAGRAFTLKLNDGSERIYSFYGPNIFRVFEDPTEGVPLREPVADPQAHILVDDPFKNVGEMDMKESDESVVISSSRIELTVKFSDGTMTVKDLLSNEIVLEEQSRAQIGNTITIKFKEKDDEYFFGGGWQNGRFSHKGKIIKIVNENDWNDNNVTSPSPFYWSNKGYAFMGYTFKQGEYDFGSTGNKIVTLTHNTNYLDYFIMVETTPVKLLNCYYQLTGNPIFLPKFGLYIGHLNAYNRDYWLQTETGGILYEDGKRYKESQTDNGGIHESLNGELENNYLFSARAVVDRYLDNDFPLGWVLPNDGYGCGYGQTDTIDGNIQNLKSFGEYARSRGVQIGLWTESNLHPVPDKAALMQRDIIREIRDAGVRVLKTDVAWVGDGYSFGLHGIAEVGELMPLFGNNARPFIITVDGWAGTQRYSSVWSGDQYGGQWEYIRFHIPTYICSGLSGIPNVASDMDGIFGGTNIQVHTRDFQWKAFTPLQLDMDGWGSNPKYPNGIAEPGTSLNRAYLKLKSMFIPYSYTIGHEAIDGMPMIRAIFLDDPNEYTLGTETKYEYLYGPNILVAPIYQNTKSDDYGDDIRDGVYFPKGDWVNYFTHEYYEGGQIYNSIDAPLWKLPIFIRLGGIIPMTQANNNVYGINNGLRIYEVYPNFKAPGDTSFTEYDDDGFTLQYKNNNEFTKTEIHMTSQAQKVTITIDKTVGEFKGMVKEKETQIRVVSQFDEAFIQNVAAQIGDETITLNKVFSLEEFESSEYPVFFVGYGVDYTKYLSEEVKSKSPMTAAFGISIKLPKADVTQKVVTVEVTCTGDCNPQTIKKEPIVSLPSPSNVVVTYSDKNNLKFSWDDMGDCAYEIKFRGFNFLNIQKTTYDFESLRPNTEYNFKIRAVKEGMVSEWVEIKAKTN